ncbi:hypothetical protein E1J38_013310 [Seonamhaeicola sediminis]|uniref:Uncharacterized protein n=1 Tax=Seonamhaeicola sediminis TaxID=2528206 RepID=A0A562YBQ8_9FLAO|nr:hypothetical protein [Seonamhaeicola sediminis]TWO31497.1 hypothetical protein E1J38_013310 [Seonamhaeicola sediminis]
MERNEILREILSDPAIIEKYGLKESHIKELKANPPYHQKITEVLSVIINENDNHLNSSMIYKKIKKVHNIG